MSLVATLALATALAADPHDPAELAYAEMDANAVIEACRYGCDRTARELAEAFLIRATAAAVLRGEIDTRSAANARFLAPDLASTWGALLPDSDGVAPEAWVRDWGKPQPQPLRPPLMPMGATPRADRDPPPPPEARPPAPPGPPPLTLRRDAPAVARLGVSITAPTSGFGADLDGDLRVQLDAPLALIVGGALGYGRSPLPPPVRDALGTDVEAITGRSGSLRLGAGPRWSHADGREVLVYGAVLGELHGSTWATWSALQSDRISLLPADHGLGAGVGAIVVQPLPGPNRLALEIDGEVEYRKRRVGARYLDPRRDGEEDIPDLDDLLFRDASASDLVRTGLDADLRWRTGEASAVSLTAGLGAQLDQRTGPRLPEVPRSPADLLAVARLGASWTF